MAAIPLQPIFSLDRVVAPLIAIVGSDGSGKSTVGAALLAWLRKEGPAELCHLGKQSGNLGRAIARLPLVGRRAGGAIEQRARMAEGGGGAGPLPALVIFLFARRRLRRFRRMLRRREAGVTILADRFPQLALPAGIDGPGFGKAPPRGAIARRLAAKEAQYFAWMVSHPPDLVLRLHVDLATALSRKPDHRPDGLAAKIADIPRLHFGSAPIVELDGTCPLPEVLAAAKAAVVAWHASA